MKDMPTNLWVSQFSTILIHNSISNLQFPAQQEIVTVYLRWHKIWGHLKNNHIKNSFCCHGKTSTFITMQIAWQIWMYKAKSMLSLHSWVTIIGKSVIVTICLGVAFESVILRLFTCIASEGCWLCWQQKWLQGVRVSQWMQQVKCTAGWKIQPVILLSIIHFGKLYINVAIKVGCFESAKSWNFSHESLLRWCHSHAIN